MLKLEKIIQLLLLASWLRRDYCSWSIQCLISGLWSANLLFMVGLLGLLLLRLLFFQRTSGNQRFSASDQKTIDTCFLGTLMIWSNAAGFFCCVAKLGGAVRTGGGADADGEFSVIFSFASGNWHRRFIPCGTEICWQWCLSSLSEELGIALGFALLFPCENPQETLVFSVPSGFGTSLCPSPQALFSAFELSMLAHILQIWLFSAFYPFAFRKCFVK